SRIAIDSSAIEIRSPAESSMSSSRRSGFGDTFFAIARRSSVVSPIAETTTTTWWPRATVSMTRFATDMTLWTSATLLPPYFWTTTAIEREYRRLAAQFRAPVTEMAETFRYTRGHSPSLGGSE